MSEAVAVAWNELAVLVKPTLAELFAAQQDRLAGLATRLDLPGGGVLFDWSKTHLDHAHLAAFFKLAVAANFADRREALFAGGVVNPTEGRAAEHTAQRGVGKEDSVEEAAALHARMHVLTEAIHQGALG